MDSGKRTREKVVYDWLRRFGPLAAHEFNAREHTGFSENTLATGCSNLAKLGKIVGKTVPTKRYKRWEIKLTGQEELPF